MKTKLSAGVALACALGLSGCSTLGAGPSGAAGGDALLEAVKAISANCSGAFNANLIFAPPMPPSGSVVVNQSCGAPAAAAKPATAPGS